MPLMRAKSIVELKGVSAWADGPWYVPQVRHMVKNGSYHTQFVATR